MKYVCRALYKTKEDSPVVSITLNVDSASEAFAAVVATAGKRKKEDVHAIEIHLLDSKGGTEILAHGPYIDDTRVPIVKAPQSAITTKVIVAPASNLLAGNICKFITLKKESLSKAPWFTANAA